MAKRGNWTDSECFYVDVLDAGRCALVAGPFRTHQEALDMVEPARNIGTEVDPKSWFYGWGTCKVENGHKEGVLNKQLGI